MRTLPQDHHDVNRQPSSYRHAGGDADETTITIDHATKTAAIWTTRRSVVTRLIRIGATRQDRVGPGVWLQVPAAAIRFRNPRKKAVSEATRGRLVAMSAATRA